jgi:hypothetical protein
MGFQPFREIGILLGYLLQASKPINSRFMKKYPFLLLIALVPLAPQVFGQHVWPVKVQKTYSKSYPLAGETVALVNRYGQMKIETWNKPEVMVEAVISVSSETNGFASSLLERINVLDEKKDDRIQFRTELQDNNNVWNSDSGGHEMKIDWTVHLPATARLDAQNSFGALTIGDYNGDAMLSCRYGTLTAGNLSNCRSLTSEFGKAVIAGVSNSKLLFRYSRVDIAKLSGTVAAEFKFCSSVDLPVDNTLKSLQLTASYTGLYLLVPKDFAADYDITTSNARLSSKNGLEFKEMDGGQQNNIRQVSFRNTHHYKGTVGRSGVTELTINSNFGNIRVL